MATLFTVTIDTEEEWDWNSGWPTKEFSVDNIQQLPRFQEICTKHGAAVTYFTDHAVLHDDAASRVMLDLSKQPGVEIGMHIHPWNTPPIDSEKKVTARESFLHNLNPDSIVAKLTTVYDCFLQRGLTPTSYRGGRGSTSPFIHEFLRDKEFVVDSSTVPYSTWWDDGAPDFRHRDVYPLRLPSSEKQNGQALWDVPGTLGFSRRPFGFWGKAYNFVERTPLRHLRLIGIAEKIGIVQKVWLSFEDPLGLNMASFLQKLRRMKLPYVGFSFHSSSLLVGANGVYSNSRDELDRLYSHANKILAMLSNWDDFEPVTITEAAIRLEKDHHACSRN